MFGLVTIIDQSSSSNQPACTGDMRNHTVQSVFEAQEGGGGGGGRGYFKPRNQTRGMLQQGCGTDTPTTPRVPPGKFEFNATPMSPIGQDIEVPKVLEGDMVTITKEPCPHLYLVDMEVINNYDQHPLHNLWGLYQHATILPIMSAGGREIILEY
jgi:hypothetical protein